MKENNFQALLGKYLQGHKDEFPETCVMELKLEKGSSLRYDRVAPHQVAALLEATGSGVYHKINDHPWKAGGGSFTNPKPFDCFLIKDARAYVVVLFYQPRKPKQAIFIDIEAWLYAEKNSERKSIRSQECLEIADRVVSL